MNTGLMTAITLAASTGLLVSPSLAQGTVAESCGKQWTIADTNNDLALSREEAEASREMDFSRLDQNGDGDVSREEWAACNDMSIVGQAMSASGGQTDAGGGFTMPDAGAGDADRSGGLSRQEMVEAMKQKFDEASETEGSSGSQEAQARFSGAWFALHDQNGDGEISSQEVAEVDLERASNQAFERADEDSDGRISRDEYDRMMTTRFEAAQERASGGQPVAIWQYHAPVD